MLGIARKDLYSNNAHFNPPPHLLPLSLPVTLKQQNADVYTCISKKIESLISSARNRAGKPRAPYPVGALHPL